MNTKYSRNLLEELKKLGLNHQQSSKVLEWTNNLPIKMDRVNNIKASIEKGIIYVTKND